MTTIVYKDGILAADTRTSHRTSKDAYCLKLKVAGRSGHDSRRKIRRYREAAEQVMFKGGRVLAAAATGSTKWVDAMHVFIGRNYDIETFNEMTFSVANSVTKDYVCSSLLIITTECGYLFKYGPEANREMVIFPLDTKRVFAIGSGGPYAYAAATVGLLSAVEAVGVAGMCDPSTSLKVDWVDCLRRPDNKPLELSQVDYSKDQQPNYQSQPCTTLSTPS